jgi:hypothetical protein
MGAKEHFKWHNTDISSKSQTQKLYSRNVLSTNFSKEEVRK